jgi:hypothetical protein
MPAPDWAWYIYVLGNGNAVHSEIMLSLPSSSISPFRTCDMNTHITLSGDLKSSNHFL